MERWEVPFDDDNLEESIGFCDALVYFNDQGDNR